MAVIPDVTLVISGTSLLGVAGVITKIIYDTKKLNGKGINSILVGIQKDVSETNGHVIGIQTDIASMKTKCGEHEGRIKEVEGRTFELAGRK
jgi:hypothetical protein